MTTHTWNDVRRLAVDAAEGKVTSYQILDWIAAYTDGQVAKAVQAERERIAQAIEVESRGSRLMVTRHVLEIVRGEVEDERHDTD